MKTPHPEKTTNEKRNRLVVIPETRVVRRLGHRSRMIYFIDGPPPDANILRIIRRWVRFQRRLGGHEGLAVPLQLTLVPCSRFRHQSDGEPKSGSIISRDARENDRAVSSAAIGFPRVFPFFHAHQKSASTPAVS